MFFANIQQVLKYSKTIATSFFKILRLNFKMITIMEVDDNFQNAHKKPYLERFQNVLNNHCTHPRHDD